MEIKNVTLATMAATALATTAAPVVLAQPEPAMTEFGGTLGCGAPVETADGHSAFLFRDPQFSDSRLDGQHVSHLDGYEDGDPDSDGVGAYAGLWEITNDGGSWLGEYATFRFAPDSYSTLSIQLDGSGGYDGQTAIMEADFLESCGWELRGVIVEGRLPDTPAPLN